MTVKYKEGLVESCILVAELEDSSQRFNVSPFNIEKGIKVIKAAYDYVGRPCKKVYISGFDLVSPKSNLNKAGILERVAFGEKLLEKVTSQSPSKF